MRIQALYIKCKLNQINNKNNGRIKNYAIKDGNEQLKQ
nr:MAG TPA: hypothetical protein [Caudoviricetes sp.]